MSFKDSVNRLTNQTNVTKASLGDIAPATELSMPAASISAYSDMDIKFQRSEKYLWYDEYVDTNYSTIDKNKSINIDPSQINITQEENSQYIPFQMDRYWDGVDVLDKTIQIFYTNSKNKSDATAPINVEYSDDIIRFGWLVNGFATAVAGKLKLEIRLLGANSKGDNYTWISRINDDINVLESLATNGIIEPDATWYTQFVREMDEKVSKASSYVEDAKTLVNEANQALNDVQDSIVNVQATITQNVLNSVQTTFGNYYDKAEVDALIANIDFSDVVADLEAQIGKIDGLKNFSSTYDSETGTLTFLNGETVITSYKVNPSTEWTTAFTKSVDDKITASVKKVEDSVVEYQRNINDKVSSIEKTTADTAKSVAAMQGTLESDYAKKSEVTSATENLASKDSVSAIENQITVLSGAVNSVEQGVSGLGDEVTALQEKVNGFTAIEPNDYDIAYKDTVFSLLENGTIKTQIIMTGGSGGGSESSVIKIDRISPSSITNIINAQVHIEYNFSSVDNAGDDTGNATAIWYVGNVKKATSTVIQGKNSFDITKFLSEGENKVKVQITDSTGSIGTKTWTVTIVNLYVESSFDDSLVYTGDITYRYTPYGNIDKTIHFILDGTELTAIKTSTSGRQQTLMLHAQSHGAHLLQIYVTATINGTEIQSDSIFSDIMWVEPNKSNPIISSAFQDAKCTAYDTVTIPYTVYTPGSMTSAISLYVNNALVSTLSVDRTRQTWVYKPTEEGVKTLEIRCGDIKKTFVLTVAKLDYDIHPVTAGLALDFNPSGRTNNDVGFDKWEYNGITMDVSENFDWVNGGWQHDDKGDYFCVMAGTTATINYNLFANDARKNGKEFKLIFQTINVRDYDAQALSCYSGGIGLRINAQNATMTSEQSSLQVPYCEDTYMEMDLNIYPDSEHTLMLMWLGGVPAKPSEYASNDNFTQPTPVPITIGSNDCDVKIYRIKAYDNDLTDREILDNFIADATTSDEMIDRYIRNDIYDASGNISPEKVSSVSPELRVITISAERMTTSKKDSVPCTVTHIFNAGGDNHNFNASNVIMKTQGTSSAAYGEAGLNLDLNFKTGGFDFYDGTHSAGYAMTENSIPVNYFNIKVNIASSENANNVCLADDYNTYQLYIRQARLDNPKVRDTVEGHPCVIFFHNTTDDTVSFYGIGDMNNSKKNLNVFAQSTDNPNQCCIELSNNTSNQCLWKSDDLSTELFDGDGNFEFRFPEEFTQGHVDAFQRVLSWTASTDRSAATDAPLQTPAVYDGVTYTTDSVEYRAAKFVNEVEDYWVLDSLLFHYLFTERHSMVDNRAKNTFPQTDDGIHWYMNMDYDNDTGDGNNNEGDLSLSYGMEDTDTIGTKDVFNASDSVLWCNVRDLCKDKLKAAFVSCEASGAWNAQRILKKFNDYQSCRPEALWIADAEKKYLNPYFNNGTTAYLSMLYGKKTYQREQYETYQEKYMSSKYLGTVATADVITYRGYTPANWSGVEPNSDLTIIPYADMYINIKYGSTTVTQRAKRGQSYVIQCPIDTTNDTEIYTYTASMIQSVGDISSLYIGYCNISYATKLQEIIIGSNVDGFQNTNFTSLSIGNNPILRRLDVRNCPNLKQALPLDSCVGLEELYAEGSGVTGVTFAPHGKLITAHLPDVSSFTAKNLNDLKELTFAGHINLTTLVLENCSHVINELELLNNAPNLNRVRLIGVDWTLSNTNLLDKLLKMAGIDENQYNTDVSIISGKAFVPVMRQQLLANYTAAWSDLAITYDTLIVQFTVTFVNDDGTILDIQYIDKGGNAIDPITRADNPIATPTKESSTSSDFTFAGWDSSLASVFANRTIKATYTESLRRYTVRYLSKGVPYQETTSEYGTYVYYTREDLPVYTDEETAYVYNLFSGWDKSGYVDGDKDINAVFDRFEYSAGFFNDKQLSDLRPVEIYGLIQLGMESDVVTEKDSVLLTLGKDFDYSDIVQKEIISEKTIFNGSTQIDTGLAIFTEDRDFVLAIDFKMAQNENNAVLAQCYQSNGTNGFKIWYNNGVRFSWGTTSVTPSNVAKREMLVIRHIKGDNNLYVYTSDLGSDTVGYKEMSRNRITETGESTTLVFGAAKADDGMFENYAVGEIHWCKIWYTDLGDTACRELASWTHERVTMEMCGFKRFYLSDNETKRSSMTFLAAHLLERTRVLTTASSNSGGWADTSLNKFMNSRLYNAFPISWKQLVKKVKVSSSVGNKSMDISTSDCYLTIPAVIEVDPTMTTEPYIYEGNSISYMTTNESRLRSFDGGDVDSYWTRSPNISYTNYFNKVSTEGDIYGYYYPQYEDGVLLMFSI